MTEIRTRELLLGAILLFLAVLLPGIWYWNISGAQPARCIFARPDCSQAVATYLLCGLTLGAAFFAAKAAIHAQEALDHERAAILSIEPCRCEERPGFVERYLRNVEYDGFVEEKPVNFDLSRYTPIDLEAHSMGRSPIIRGRVPVIVRGREASSNATELLIGNIPSEGLRHLRLWLPSDFAGMQIFWKERGTHRHADDMIVYVSSAIRVPLRTDFDQDGAEEHEAQAERAPIAPPRKKPRREGMS